MKFKTSLAIAALAIFVQSGANAAPIVYAGSVTPNGATVTGQAGPFAVFDPFGIPLNETFFTFWSFTVNQTTPFQLLINVNRLNTNLDPFLSLYRGLITPGTDTSAFNPFASFDAVTYIGSADDEIPAPGPFGDPQFFMVLQGAGTYTIAVGGSASDCPLGVCPANGYPYALQVQIPEPGTLPLLLVALAGIGWALRRQGLGQAASPRQVPSA